MQSVLSISLMLQKIIEKQTAAYNINVKNKKIYVL